MGAVLRHMWRRIPSVGATSLVSLWLLALEDGGVVVGRRRFRQLPVEMRRRVIEEARKGRSQREISRLTSVSIGSVKRVLKPLGGVLRAELVDCRGGQLSLDDRFQVYEGRNAGETMEAIGVRIGRHKSTVCRELQRCPGRYRPIVAHQQAVAASRRPKPAKLDAHPRLRAAVEDGLKALWSPEEISRVLAELYPGDPTMNISHETIYQCLYVQGRGELRRELASCLRTGRAIRRQQHRSNTTGKIAGMINISERLPEIEDRAVPGHWEGDLIIGAGGKSAVGTLVERTSRFVILFALPHGRSANAVCEAMTAAIMRLPAHLRRSITWDQGSEMAAHQRFSVATGIDIYFCDPHSPWQRGSNENTNGLLRQYLPKSTDLSKHNQTALDTIADSLNQRPRKTLGWATPANLLNLLLVAPTG
jgi:IS30 family transposase